MTYKRALTGLSKVVALVYKVTAPDDLCLRLFVTQQCIAAYDSVVNDKSLLTIVRTNEPIAWEAARPLQVRLDEVTQQLREAEDELTAKSVELADLSELRKAEARTCHCSF